MKKILLLLFVTGYQAFAQNPVPNPGFENWSAGNPVGWTTTNVLTITPISQSNQAHSGSSAAKLEVMSVFSVAINPVLICNSVTINQNYQTFSYYYKANLTAGDLYYTTVMLTENGNGHGVGVDSLTSSNNTNVYTQRSFSIQYVPPVTNIADMLHITTVISGPNSGTPTIGSNVTIDDLNLTGGTPTGLQENSGNELTELGLAMPNPATSYCLIPFSLKEAGKVDIELYSTDGKMVRTVLHEKLNAGKYKAECEVEGLPPGLYLFKFRVNERVQYTKIYVQ